MRETPHPRQCRSHTKVEDYYKGETPTIRVAGATRNSRHVKVPGDTTSVTRARLLPMEPLVEALTISPLVGEEGEWLEA